MSGLPIVVDGSFQLIRVYDRGQPDRDHAPAPLGPAPCACRVDDARRIAREANEKKWIRRSGRSG